MTLRVASATDSIHTTPLGAQPCTSTTTYGAANYSWTVDRGLGSWVRGSDLSIRRRRLPIDGGEPPFREIVQHDLRDVVAEGDGVVRAAVFGIDLRRVREVDVRQRRAHLRDQLRVVERHNWLRGALAED